VTAGALGWDGAGRPSLSAVTDWVTISSLATAGGTLVLAAGTFASVRSANRAARAAESSLLAGLRPLLVPTRLQDTPEKVHFADDKWVVVPGGGGVAEVSDEAVYLALSVRNVGTGIAVLHGARFYPERRPGDTPAPLDEFRRLTRDLYIPPGKVGFWQGAFRDEDDVDREVALEAIEYGEFGVDVLYGDYEGGQRVVTRFGCLRGEDGTWSAAAGRHWQIDRENPR
jgi:hypothetical protein